MPTRQEVLEGLRVLAEEIMQSLRLLLTMLFSMTRAIQPEEEVGDAEMNPLNQLIQEVRIQKTKIEALGNLMHQQFHQQCRPGNVSPTTSVGHKSDAWEIYDVEEVTSTEDVNPRISQAAQVHGSSPPRASTTATTQKSPHRAQVPQIAGMQVRPKPAGVPSNMPMEQVNDHGNQVSLTHTALAAWGQKVVTWGRKHQGSTFCQVFEQDQSYVRWVLARISTLNEDMADFASYATTRRRLEEMVVQQVQP